MVASSSGLPGTSRWPTTRIHSRSSSALMMLLLTATPHNGRRDSFAAAEPHRVTADDPYFNKLRRGWGEGLRSVFGQLPDALHQPLR